MNAAIGHPASVFGQGVGTMARVDRMMPYRIVRLWRSFSATGLVVGTLFLAASLTPSLIPRTYTVQGILSGFCLAAGYGAGSLGHWLWSYLELPEPGARAQRIIKLVAAAACAAIILAFLWQAADWQNSIRIRMELPPTDGVEFLQVGALALMVFGAVMVVARILLWALRLFSGHLKRLMPRRVSNVLGAIAALTLFGSLIDGVLLKFGLRVADASYRQVDALVDPEIGAPANSVKTGSTASLVAWDDLGRMGRGYILSGPTSAQIGEFVGGDALEPIRVYVGLNSEESPEARARLALEELRRTGAFERSVLVVITPPGTGWINPAGIDTVEYLHRGDVASVAAQYSYLPSWLSLLSEPEYGAESARALFKEVYEHWRQLPREDRPRLYLYGLSLGALNSDLSTDLFDVVGDPFHGALWSGPPFASKTWRSATRNRNRGSPAWLPRFRESSIIRFTNQENALDVPGAEWGPLRIVYLQYASDPVTFFEPSAFYREPEWMAGPRAPDVSPELQWFPVVSFLQLAFDITAATTTPPGYGHVYAPEDYIDAWIEVTEPEGWTAKDIGRLKAFMQQPTKWPAETTEGP